MVGSKIMENNEITKKSVKWAFIGSLSLFIIYFSILSIANSFKHAIDQFIQMWYWVSLLVIGFGIQVGLYSFIRNSMKQKLAGAATEVAASGGISTGSMIACCAHHLSDVLPIIGLSAAALFLDRFQTLFIVVGVLSNLIGINMMLKIIQDNKLYVKKNGFLYRILTINMRKSLYAVVAFSVIIFLIELSISLR